MCTQNSFKQCKTEIWSFFIVGLIWATKTFLSLLALFSIFESVSTILYFTCFHLYRPCIFNRKYLAVFAMCRTRVWGGWGGEEGNLGVILVRVCEPVFQNLPHSYTWPSKKRTHSYTWSSKMLTYSYTALWLFVPIFCWLLHKYQSIHVIPRG